jgi:hypothetical protein
MADCERRRYREEGLWGEIGKILTKETRRHGEERNISCIEVAQLFQCVILVSPSPKGETASPTRVSRRRPVKKRLMAATMASLNRHVCGTLNPVPRKRDMGIPRTKASK